LLSRWGHRPSSAAPWWHETACQPILPRTGEGLEPLPGKSNFLCSVTIPGMADRRSELTAKSDIGKSGPGIDMYLLRQPTASSNTIFVIQPAHDPDRIRLAFPRGRRVEVDRLGELIASARQMVRSGSREP